MKDDRINLCTLSLYVAPESRGTRGVKVEYPCVKDCFSVKACRHFKPMTCAGGLKCYGECEYFDEMQCKCRAARSEARKRAIPLVKSWVGR